MAGELFVLIWAVASSISPLEQQSGRHGSVELLREIPACNALSQDKGGADTTHYCRLAGQAYALSKMINGFYARAVCSQKISNPKPFQLVAGPV